MRWEDSVRVRGEPRTCPRCDTPFPRQAIVVPVKCQRDKGQSNANSDNGKGKDKEKGKVKGKDQRHSNNHPPNGPQRKGKEGGGSQAQV